MLWAVPIERGDLDADDAFRPAAWRKWERLLPIASVFPGNDLCFAENLEARLRRVVHQKQGNPRIGAEVSGADVLAVAGDIGKGDGVVVNNMQEAGSAAAKLDVGPAGFADGRHVKTVAEADEVSLVRAQTVVRRAAFVEHFAGVTAAHFGLNFFDRRREGKGREVVGHSRSL